MINSNSYYKRIFHTQPECIVISFTCLVVVILLFSLPSTVSAAPTTEVHIVKFAPDGITVLNETTVSYQWMESHLPVQGDGITHYYHQGPVFVDDKEGQWDVNETTNFKDHGAVKGTDIKDLCALVGGMQPGDEVMIKAVDGYHVEFGFDNVYNPQPRQGPIVLTWYNGEETSVGERQGVGYPPEFFTGMRLIFFADTSVNAEGKHVFGNNDMRVVMPADKIHLFDNLYPSTNGYTVKWVDEIRVYTGGYHGSGGVLAKSMENKADTLPGAPQKSPLLTFTSISGIVLLVVIVWRRST